MAELMDNAGAALEVPRLSVHEVCEPEEQDSFFSDPETFGLPTTLSCLGIDWNLLDISEFETYEPLGILVELARTGKIDPWDIDIVQLTDNFLGRVEELQKMDLRISSRTLLYSAILLRMKSSGILDVEEEVDSFESDFLDELDLPEPDEFPIPKLPVRRVSTRPVTLNELILELKKAEKTLSRKNEKKARQIAEEPHLLQDPQLTTGEILGIAHEEAIGSRLVLIWARLAELFMTDHVVVFSSFLETSEDRIMDYLSLLFLASNRKIWLFQNELFEELYIYPGEESGFSTENNPLLFHEAKIGLDGEVSEYRIKVPSESYFTIEPSLEEELNEEPEKTLI
ncbi:MAG: ScpA family protein [Methanosarcina sp.]